jgi:hypothetical protein
MSYVVAKYFKLSFMDRRDYAGGDSTACTETTMADYRTLHDDCEALNAAFDELGFEWQWDPKLYASLGSGADERDRVSAYLREYQPHLLHMYDLAQLCDAIEAARQRHRAELKAA